MSDSPAVQYKPVVVVLIRHFLERWEKRVGLVPSLDVVNQMLHDSVKLRSQMLVYRRSYRGFRPYKMLAEYWHNSGGLIIKVDEDLRCAVTVIAAKCPAGQ